MCGECGKTFASGSNLKQHQTVHEVDEDRSMYICKVVGCEKVYNYYSSLRKHIRKSHPEIKNQENDEQL